MKLVRGEARKATALAMSSGAASAPVGCWASRAVRASSDCFATISVATPPGATALTAMPRGKSSIAIARVRPTTAAYEAT